MPSAVRYALQQKQIVASVRLTIYKAYVVINLCTNAFSLLSSVEGGREVLVSSAVSAVV